MTEHVDVQFAVEHEATPDAEELALWVCRAIEAAGASQTSEVAVRVVGADEMRALNESFRDQDKSTNVLSFPAGDIDGLPADAGVPLGDIVVCAEVVHAESIAQTKAAGDHWAHMIVHGTLHLLGFDHIEDADAERMEGLECEILTRFGIADPYAEPRQET